MKIRFGSAMETPAFFGGVQSPEERSLEEYLTERDAAPKPKKVGYLFLRYNPPLGCIVEQVHTSDDLSEVYSIEVDELDIWDLPWLIILGLIPVAVVLFLLFIFWNIWLMVVSWKSFPFLN